MAAEYQEHFGEHAYDDEGNYIGTPIEASESEGQEAWAEYYAEHGLDPATDTPEAAAAAEAAPEAAADAADVTDAPEVADATDGAERTDEAPES